MRIGGPHIRPPQWTRQPDPIGRPQPKLLIERPALRGPGFEPDPARTLMRRLVGIIARKLGLDVLGRFGRKIARAVLGFLFKTIGRRVRLIFLLLEALFELLNPIRAFRRAGRARHAGPARGASPHGPSVRVDGPNGFLFKPRSDSDGKAVVLLPEKLTGKIDHVVLKGPDGQVIEKGRFSGIGNGDRAHFRFSKPGGAYPPGTVVEVRLDDGSTRQWTLTNPAQRHD